MRELTAEEKLYAIPDHLKGEDKEGRYVAQAGPGDKEESDGGPMAWNTGIAEVELPIEFKLKNIEQTEEIKARMSGFGGRGGLNHASSALSTVGNMTANYKLHQRNWVQNMRSKGSGNGEQGKGQGICVYCAVHV